MTPADTNEHFGDASLNADEIQDILDLTTTHNVMLELALIRGVLRVRLQFPWVSIPQAVAQVKAALIESN